VEHAHPVDRTFSWRGLALAALLILVVVLAVLAGMALLHRLGGTRPVPGTGHGSKGPVSVPVRPRSRVSVLVLNGNGVNGAAGTEATHLVARGYAHAIPTDAQNHGYARSVVLYRPGWQGEAERLARDAKIAAIAPLDGRVAPAYARDQLIVILGG
jgi:LytR cell envelope-related transcriptional attenuator